MKFGEHGCWIYTLLFCRETNQLLAGDDNGKVIQYKRNEEGIWNVTKNYGDLKIGPIISNKQYGHLVFFGGWETNKMRVLNLKKQELFGKEFKTAMNQIYSFTFCEVSPSKVLLSVSGYKPDYSNSETDIFDVSDLLSHFSLLPENLQIKTPKSIPKKTIPKKKNSPIKKCQCNSKQFLGLIMTKMEYCITQVVDKIVGKINKNVNESKRHQEKLNKKMRKTYHEDIVTRSLQETSLEMKRHFMSKEG